MRDLWKGHKVSETPDTDGLYNSLLAENPNNPVYLEVMLQHTRELERERNELVGVIKSLRKNAKEDSDRIEKLEQALQSLQWIGLEQALIFGSNEMS
jgi:hypothetical protein